MMSRFFRSALSALVVATLPLAAQTVAPGPGATPAPVEVKKPKVGYLRFWNMLPTESGEFQLLQDTGAAELTVLLGAEPMNLYANYVEAKPGRYALKLVRSADSKTVLKTFDLILKADVLVTFYIKSDAGKLSAEMLDDTYDPEKTLTGKLTLRNFVKDTTVTVKSATLPQPATLAYGEERILDNLPLKATIFQLQATLPDGKAKNWSNEVDFRANRRASLFMVLDAYGRFRPRVTIDGQAEVDFSKTK